MIAKIEGIRFHIDSIRKQGIIKMMMMIKFLICYASIFYFIKWLKWLCRKIQKKKSQEKKDEQKEKQEEINLNIPIKRKIIVGEAATGKTSLLNHFFNLNYPVGLGQCTKQQIQVFKTQSVSIHDSAPLQSNEFSDQWQVYQSITKYDQIFVCFCSSLKGISKFIENLVQIKKTNQVYFIRTKCDIFDQQQSRNIKEEIQADKKLLIKYGFTQEQINICGVSIKKPNLMEVQNQKVKQLMKK